MSGLRVEEFAWGDGGGAAVAQMRRLRYEELRVPLGQTEQFPWPLDGPSSRYFLAFPAEETAAEAVGTVGLHDDGGGRATLFQMAVAARWQGRGVGRALVEALLRAAVSDDEQRHPIAEIGLKARTSKAGFYARFGFAACGAEHAFNGIPHVDMRLQLRRRTLRWDDRTRRILGERAADALCGASVAVVGVGGVGGWCVEALARAGIGRLLLVDADDLALTNVNRHVLGTLAAVGTPKVALARERVLAINPHAVVDCRREFVRPDTPLFGALFPEHVQVVVDACDSLLAKVHIAAACVAHVPPVPVISALGAARRLDPTRVRVTTLDKTFGDPLAARLRKALRKAIGDEHLQRVNVVFSDEPPCEMARDSSEPADPSGAKVLPSFVTVPASAGLAAAHFVVSTILSSAGTPPVPPAASAASSARK